MQSPTLSEVAAEARAYARSVGVRLFIRAVPSDDDDVNDGIPCFGRSNPVYGIAIKLDPKRCSPILLWAVFCHEMGHQQQFQSGEYVRWFFSSSDERAHTRRAEIDAWNRAERIADDSVFPTNNEFRHWRRACLRTYGIREEAA